MSEKTQWDRVRELLDIGERSDLVRVENSAWPGTPDVSYCLDGVEGWIELKQVEKWPIRPATPLRVEHFTAQQRAWLTRRSVAGGRVWVLLRVGVEWLLFEGRVAASLLGNVPRAVLYHRCYWRWTNHLIGPELRAVLKDKPKC